MKSSFEDFLYEDEMSYHDGEPSTPEAISKRIAIALLADAEIVHNNLVETNLIDGHTSTTQMLMHNATALNGLRRAVMEDDRTVIMELENMAGSQKGYGHGNDEQYHIDGYEFAIELFSWSDLAK